MATKLNQIIALEKGAKNKGQQGLTTAHHRLQRVTGFSGVSRTYQPKDEDGERFPPESSKVQYTVGDVVSEAAAGLVRMFDVVLTKDVANQSARANIVVDGDVLATDVPITYLLWLEKQLTDLHTFFTKLPVLDADEVWNFDPATGTFRTDPVGTNRTKKVYRNHELSPATDHHPAQVQVYTEDTTVGTWSTTKFSGAIPATDRQLMISRVEKLQDAVKMAREEANSREVSDRKIGEDLFHYLLASGE